MVQFSTMKRIIKKICLFGDTEVGKTALIRRYVLDQFSDEYIKTLGAMVSSRKMEYYFDREKYIITDMILEVGGETLCERQGAGLAETVIKRHLAGSGGLMLVYDRTDEESFKKISDILGVARRIAGNIPVVVLGNKTDRVGCGTIKFEEQLLKKIGNGYSEYFFTSAKTDENIVKAFETINRFMLEI